jgi:TetR/AcrR family transcriptional regulator, transcriptional repressor for nem operon
MLGPMPAGRPKAFDETQVLEKAMELFWLRGYQRLGLTELLSHLGISRQSLYDTFGNKRALFVRAIEHYRSTQLAQALALLDRHEAPLENVKAVMRFFEALAMDQRARGCLVANALVEIDPSDRELSSLLAETLEMLRAGVEKALRTAQQRGELRTDRSPVELSRTLVNAIIGMAVSGRLPLPASAIAEIHAGTLRLLD